VTGEHADVAEEETIEELGRTTPAPREPAWWCGLPSVLRHLTKKFLFERDRIPGPQRSRKRAARRRQPPNRRKGGAKNFDFEASVGPAVGAPKAL